MAEVEIPLPLGALQLAGMHLDCGAFPGNDQHRVCAKVVIPAGVAATRSWKRSQPDVPSGSASTGRVRGWPVRAPVVVNMTIGRPETQADKVVRPG